MINYDEADEFAHDLKKLLKKFSSLIDDLKVVKKNAIELFHINQIDSRSVFEIQGVGNTEELKFYKIKKFACKSLKGKGNKSGIRVIYAYFPAQKKVIFLEIYFKAKQENENRKRIENFIKVIANGGL